jgi:hypothetical protein
MTREQELLRLVEELVEKKMDKMRYKASELSGRGGHTVISSRKDIIFQPIYSPELDDMVVVRCTEQRHRLEQKRLRTTMRGFRV